MADDRMMISMITTITTTAMIAPIRSSVPRMSTLVRLPPDHEREPFDTYYLDLRVFNQFPFLGPCPPELPVDFHLAEGSRAMRTTPVAPMRLFRPVAWGLRMATAIFLTTTEKNRRARWPRPGARASLPSRLRRAS